jgi:DNA-directed RNA polymerase specialized sigma24 family protein
MIQGNHEVGVNDRTTKIEPNEFLQAAREAAEKREPAQMLEHLAASKFLDGLLKRLQQKWDALPETEIEDCVACAVDDLYDAIGSGRYVRNLDGWLWKVANNKADDTWRKDYRLRNDRNDELPEDPDESITDAERTRLDALAEHRRAEAIRFARRLIPRIGQGQIASMMELLLDAVEKRIPDLPSSIIADSLGISDTAARTLGSV